MREKHTPGPWRFVGGSTYDEDTFASSRLSQPPTYTGPGYYDNPAVVGLGDQEVVGCDEYDVFSGKDAEERVANVRLIPAAPEMLEVCRAVSDASHTMSETIRMARAAIAKAEGRS